MTPDQAENLWDSLVKGHGGSESALVNRLTRVALRGLEAEERGYEAIIASYSEIQWQDPLESIFNAGATGQFLVAPPPPYFRQNYGYGEDIPVYITEQGLRYIRDISRIICSASEYAISAMENRQSYLVGTGLRYQIEPAKVGTDKALLRRGQELIDFFCEYNDLSSIESEAVRRMDEDGEAFIRLFPYGNGLMKVRFVEPEHVTSSGIKYPVMDPQHSFGIETRKGDIEDVLGYWVIPNPLYSWVPEFVPASQMIHLKTTTHRAVKRGLPLFYSVTRNLKRVEEMMGSLSALARARAKIALIRRVKNGTPSAIAALGAAVTRNTVVDPSNQTISNVESLQDGTILTSTNAIEYDMPSAQTGAAEFIEVIRQELRGIAARVVMPTWMFSSDTAEMAGGPAAMVAESPSVKKFERDQKYLRGRFGETRYGPATGLMWRFLQHAAEVGYFPASELSDYKIKVIAPPVATRDKLVNAQSDTLYHTMGAKSIWLIQQENGWDTEINNAHLAEEKANEALRQPTPAFAKQGQNAAEAKGEQATNRRPNDTPDGSLPDDNQNPMRKTADGQ